MATSNRAKKLILSLVLALPLISAVDLEKIQSIPAGKFLPLYVVSLKKTAVKIEPFKIDRFPVTNQEYLSFVEATPNWEKGAPTQMLSDQHYLEFWSAGSMHNRFAPDQGQSPVTRVSWFAADAYCAWKGGRLPSVAEWEYVAAASDSKRDASRDTKFVEKLLAWYAVPSNGKPPGAIGRSQPNYYRVSDMHGLIWEWTDDFNSVFVSGDNRRDNEELKNLFCGNGVGNATDRANYAGFMRYALRNSLKANYTLENLGFRCAYD